EKKQITINIIGPGKFNIEGPDKIQRKVISELSGKNDLPTETK
ncbi:MAG: hypothetical protein K0R17_3790, partial [Rariglobus sp.]|nr:hypothetical protein [Rariglobus sp.]